MGCKASLEIPPSAPNPPETWNAKYEEGKHYHLLKDAEKKILLAPEGVASSDEKDGSPIRTLLEVFEQAVKRHGSKPALLVERLEDGKAPPMGEDKKVPPALPIDKWTKWTFAEYYTECKSIAKSLIALKVEQFGTLAIWGFNAPEWTMAMMGSILMGAKAAGIYPTDTPDQVKYKCSHSSADVIVVEDMKKYLAVKSICEELKHLKAIVMWGDEPPEAKIERKTGGPVHVFNWANFVKYGDENKVSDDDLTTAMSKVKAGHCCALIYTSGTTGRPKAVMICHDNLLFEANGVHRSMVEFGKGGAERLISYLPLSHIAGMLVDVVFPIFLAGYTKGWFETHFARPYDLKYGSLKDRLVAVKPTLFVGVPRVWEKIAEKMKAKAADISGLKLTIARWAKGKGLTYAKNCQIGGNGKKPFNFGMANKIVLSKIKDALGLDEMKAGITAAAPIGRHTLEYYGSLGIQINEVYGMSESTGGSTVSTNMCHQWGSCGFQMPGIQVKIFKVDEKDMNKKEECPLAEDINLPTEAEQGEICFRGRGVMMGYMANPEFGEEHMEQIKKKNEGAIDNEGWLHSGDKGAKSKLGMIKITGRYKELIIGAGGENVAPVPIETNIKKLCDSISNIMMYGDKMKFNVCILTLKTVGASGQEPGTNVLDGPAAKINPDTKTVTQAMHDEKVIKAITEAIVATNKNQLCCPSNAAKIQKFTILPADFSVATGELTSTLKLKRSVAAKKYEKEIKAMYDSKDVYVPFYTKEEAEAKEKAEAKGAETEDKEAKAKEKTEAKAPEIGDTAPAAGEEADPVGPAGAVSTSEMPKE
ncbi:hypothetical protein AAMO2058_000212000 [Amorphochlora amoebiformis]